MGLVNGIDMLRQARAGGYAVGAFDLINLEFLAGVITGAVACRSPVILSVAEIHLDYVDLDLFAPALRRAAERVPVPVSVHLDHGEDLATVKRALAAGFTSVMIDGSNLPYEENVRVTREAVRMAHAAGAAVEAELGYVAGREFYAGGRDAAEANVEIVQVVYTDPDQAADFVARTGCDSLAVSVGTVHGLYRERPRFDIPRLREIREKVGVPLVLHGGSGLTDDEYRRLIAAGISKINFYTELSHAATRAVKEAIAADPEVTGITRVLAGVKEAVRGIVEDKFAVWGSAGRAGKEAEDGCDSTSSRYRRRKGASAST